MEFRGNNNLLWLLPVQLLIWTLLSMSKTTDAVMTIQNGRAIQILPPHCFVFRNLCPPPANLPTIHVQGSPQFLSFILRPGQSGPQTQGQGSFALQQYPQGMIPPAAAGQFPQNVYPVQSPQMPEQFMPHFPQYPQMPQFQQTPPMSNFPQPPQIPSFSQFPQTPQIPQAPVTPPPLTHNAEPVITPLPPPQSSTTPKPSNSDISGLESGNRLRALHGAPPLENDSELEKDAQAYAEHLGKIGALEHSKPKPGEYGENLAKLAPRGNASRSIAEAIEAWYGELPLQCPKPGKLALNFPAAGHFTQLIWKGSKRVGYGRAVGADGYTYIVARYKPPGNVLTGAEVAANIQC